MSFFYSTRTLATKTPLNPSIDRTSALAFLHDHNTFQNLQPLLVSNKSIETPPVSSEALVKEATAAAPPGVKPDYREVTIRVPMGPISQLITTLSAFIDTDDGLIVVFQAPMSLSGMDQWKIIPTEGGEGFTLLEESTMTGLAPLMPFVASTKKGSHTELGESFMKKLLEKK